jgi:hypothetical protein
VWYIPLGEVITLTITIHKSLFVVILVAALIAGYVMGDRASYSYHQQLYTNMQTMTHTYNQAKAEYEAMLGRLDAKHAEIDRVYAANERVLKQIEAHGYQP